MNISAPEPNESSDPDGAVAATHPGDDVVVPGEGAHATRPGPSFAAIARLAGDALAVVALVWALWWLIDDDGGLRSMATAQLGYLLLVGAPAAIAEARRQPRFARVVVLILALGWLTALAFGVDRSGFVDSALVAGMAPLMYLLASRVHRRGWGPAAIVAIVAVSFSAWAWEALLKWWGFVQLGTQPRWDLLSWRNQSGILSGAFGLFLLGPTLAGRRTLPLLTGGLAALGLAGAWLSSSRGAIVFTALGSTAAVATASWWAWRLEARRWWGPAIRGVAVGIAAVTIAAGLLSTLPEGAESPVGSRTESVSGNATQRGQHWRTAVRMGASRPLVGLGPGSYQSSMPLFNAPEGRLTAAAHNEWLEAWSDGGVVLALPMWLVAGAGAWLVVSRGRRPDPDFDLHDPGWSRGLALRQGTLLGAGAVVIAVGGHAAVDFDFHYPVLAAMFATGMAVLATGRPSSAPPTGAAATQPPLRALLADRSLLLAGAGVLSTGLVLALGIWGATRESNARSSALDTATAEEIGSAQAPWDTPARLFVANRQRELGDLDEAIRTLQPAVDWSPLDPRPALAQARLRYQLGEISDVDLVSLLDDPPTRLREWSITADLLLLGGSLDLADQVAAIATAFHPTYQRWGIEETVGQAWQVRIGVALSRDDCTAVREHLDAAAASGFDVGGLGIVDALRALAEPHCELTPSGAAG